MKNKANIGIVTPSFNQVSYIRETLESVLTQKFSGIFHYVVMDGGSTDGSADIIESYSENFFSWKSEVDLGQAHAIHEGHKILDTDILCYLNSDDVLFPGTFQFVLDFFERHPSVDFIYSHRVMIDENSKVVGFWILPRHSDYLMKRWDLIPQETLFWRSSAMKKVGPIDPTYMFAMDYDFLVRLMNSCTGRRVNRFLGAFRLHNKSKTQTELNTVGHLEISRIWSKYNLTGSKYVGEAFSGYVRIRSRISPSKSFSRKGVKIKIGANFPKVSNSVQ